MTPAEMVALVQSRTKHPSSSKVTAELQSAYRWALRRIYNTADGPDLLVTIGEELTLSTRTKTLELSAVLSQPFIGVKQLWAKLSGDTTFTPLAPADTNDSWFALSDADPSSATLVAVGHPIFYDVINFSQVRFAPALPAGAILRVDYYRFGLPLDVDPESSESSEESESSSSIGVSETILVIEDAVLDKICAKVFGLLNDEREEKFDRTAESNLIDAIWVLQRRSQPPITMTPFRARRRRVI